MKKIFILLAANFIALPLFAYNNYNNSAGSSISIFIDLLLFVWGILNIILFFKIWVATDDLRELKVKSLNEDADNRINKEKFLSYYYHGEDDKAYHYLNQKFIDIVFTDVQKIQTRGRKSNREEIFEEELKKTIEYIAPYYKFINREIPERLRKTTYSEIDSLGEE